MNDITQYILIVDDRPENLLAMETWLDPCKAHIIRAGSGKEALWLLLKNDFALVILDVQMPEMDGFETAELMRENPRTRHIPIIFVSAISKERKYVFKGYETGAVDYLLKPFDPEILKSKVRVFLELHRQKLLIQKQARSIQETKEFLETVMDNAMDAIYVLDKEGRFTYMNHRGREITGFSEAELLGQSFTILLPPKEINAMDVQLHIASCQGLPVLGQEAEIITRSGIHRMIAYSLSPLSRDTLPASVVGTAEDITERKKMEERIKASLSEKTVLLREIHHRVKNNMQVISSLLALQAGTIKEEKTLEIFRESRNRIRSIALVHEKLYRSTDMAKVDFKKYVESLVKELLYSFHITPDRVEVVLDIHDITIDLDTAVPCGLVINELITNALKHAFPGARAGRITIGISSDRDEGIVILVADDGVGLAQDLDIHQCDSLGLQLVATIIEHQLDGTMEVDRSCGTQFRITLKQVEGCLI